MVKGERAALRIALSHHPDRRTLGSTAFNSLVLSLRQALAIERNAITTGIRAAAACFGACPISVAGRIKSRSALGYEGGREMLIRTSVDGSAGVRPIRGGVRRRLPAGAFIRNQRRVKKRIFVDRDRGTRRGRLLRVAGGKSGEAAVVIGQLGLAVDVCEAIAAEKVGSQAQ